MADFRIDRPVALVMVADIAFAGAVVLANARAVIARNNDNGVVPKF